VNAARSVKIGILGAAGRMGQMIAREILGRQYAGAELGAAVDGKDSWALGRDLGEVLGFGPSGVTVSTDAAKAFEDCDVLIDFTTPEATMAHAALAYESGRAYVVGTTGLGQMEEAGVIAAAQRAPVLQSANMSVGVNVLLALVAQVAEKLDDKYDIEIFEAHHRQKIDAPSGTALALGHAAAAARGTTLDAAMVAARFGQIGARIPGSIGISVFRGGDVIGDHTVTFAGAGERLELTHKASDRGLFARGAVKAALWLHDKPIGRYTMRDVIGI
jgi:4-hydroxy-tetrahydrodipicolinate reductase